MAAVVVAAAVALAGCGGARQAAVLGAVRPDTAVTLRAPLARFEDARAVGIDPGGTVYVADAARDVIVRLPQEEGRAEVLGGPGSDAGQFDGPADVDPTNGLVFVVADAGNGRIQRFSQEFRHLETLPVGRGYAAAGEQPARPVFDVQADDSNDLGGGRPVAVTEPSAGGTYALDAADGHVLKWEDERQSVRVIGGFAEGNGGALQAPVDLAVGPRGTLYVADRGRNALMTYDRFGSFLGERALGRADSARAVATGSDGRVYLARPRSVLVFGAEGRLLRRVRLEPPSSASTRPGGVVDVAPFERGLYVLTSEALFRFKLP